MASSTRSLRSFPSISVAPPTRESVTVIAKELGTNRSAAGRFPISNLQYVQTPPFGRGAGVCYGRRGITPTWGASREAAMIGVLNDLVLFSCLAAFVSGIVIAAATLLI